jgi:hypothetical protein
VRGPHNVRIERSTFVNSGTSWLMGSFGRAWTDDHTVTDGGPMEGLVVLDNVFASNGEYGATAPDGQHFGRGIGDFVSRGLQISGNVFGDAPREHVSHYNRHKAAGAENVTVPRAQVMKKLSADGCGEWAAGKGADCRRLQPIFEWRRRLPEP